MTPPDATREEVELYLAAARAERTRARRSEANRHDRSTCSSCGRRGHRRGVAACPNYDSPWRWLDKGAVYLFAEDER